MSNPQETYHVYQSRGLWILTLYIYIQYDEWYKMKYLMHLHSLQSHVPFKPHISYEFKQSSSVWNRYMSVILKTTLTLGWMKPLVHTLAHHLFTCSLQIYITLMVWKNGTQQRIGFPEANIGRVLLLWRYLTFIDLYGPFRCHNKKRKDLYE